jgi:hypothetical protein
MENKNIDFGPVFKAGLIAGFIAMGANNLWSLVAAALGATIPPGFFLAVTVSSLIPMVVASLVYFVLARFVPKGAMVFTVLGFLFIVFSFYPVFNTHQLPDGTPLDDTFPLLAAPMHVISGALALYGIPKWSR